MSTKYSTTATIALLLLSVATSASRAEDAPRSTLKLGQMLRDAGAIVVSCDLRVQFSQCRQYAVSPGQAEVRLAQIEESCESLGGRFKRAQCPSDAVMARCREVKFRRDVFYDNAYYAGEPARWTPETLEHACKHLPGQFEPATAVMPPAATPQTRD